MRDTNKLKGFLVLAVFVIALSSTAQVKLPRLVSDNMVLQRDTDVRVWGWASSEEKITVSFNKKNYTTQAGANGDWQVTLPRLKSGGPYTMLVKGNNNQVEIKNVMVGDVWVCSGQSNMELNMQRVEPLYKDLIADANNEFIRYFRVPYKYDFSTPSKDIASGNWQITSPETVREFGAVAYFFGKELYEKYKVPIGLINSSMGGSPIEAWLSEDALKQFPHHLNEALKFRDANVITQLDNADRAMNNAWHTKLRLLDDGYVNKETPWYSYNYNSSDWPSMKIPGYWADSKLGSVNGVVWFIKEIDVPSSMAGQPAQLILGRIVDSDSVYVNGTFVGTTGYQYPPRRYKVPSNVLKEGKNKIVVRIINNSGRGGFVEDKEYALYTDKDTIDLKGDWRYRLGAKMDPMPGQIFIRWKPMGLYNGMIAPLTNFTIKGVIWYQGESNTGNPQEYEALLPALIKEWREKWKQGEFPFLYVQLPNFMMARPEPTESNWARFREAQAAAQSVSNTGMAVAIDLGEWNDIHPLNKLDVGKRLALVAQKVAYGDEKVVFSGPTYSSQQIDGDKIIVMFSNIGRGLVARAGELRGFAIAGPDKKFVWAKAKIDGDKVIVWNEQVAKPVAVRYAWADNPETANLYNAEGLPAAPFRTDR